MTVETGTPTVNSRWRCDVKIASTYTQLRGMNNFAPLLIPTEQDATDYDNTGWASKAVTLREWQNTAGVFRKVYGTAFDPAQEALRAAADSQALVTVRWYERGTHTGREAYEGEALIKWEPQGGDAAGLGSVNVTMLGQGARRVITPPTEEPETP